MRALMDGSRKKRRSRTARSEFIVARINSRRGQGLLAGVMAEKPNSAPFAQEESSSSKAVNRGKSSTRLVFRESRSPVSTISSEQLETIRARAWQPRKGLRDQHRAIPAGMVIRT